MDAVGCLIAAIEQPTGVRIDEIVVVDFAAFVEIVDSLGGVPVCLPGDITAAEAHLDLRAGAQVLDGSTLLSLSRARWGPGTIDGTETPRLGREAEVYAALIRTLLASASERTLPEFADVVDQAFADTVRLPAQANPDHLAELLWPLRDADEADVVPTAGPVEWDADGTSAAWGDEAQQLFADIQNDTPIPSEAWPACSS
jgi:anionic cell wall polymer biosynthesis LytR-Cps2A-Psr (LCP) family protein